MNPDDRFIYYIGDFLNSKNETIIKPEYDVFKLNDIFHYTGSDQKYDDFPIDKGFLSPGFWWGYNNGFLIDFECLMLSSDGFETDDSPVITKARVIGKKNNGILIKGEYARHWGVFLNELKEGDPIKWEDKKNEIIWRGVHCTGITKNANRRTCVSKFYNKYNIGFNVHDPQDEYYKNNSHLFKDNMTIKQLLEYKYLLCIEGNDVATGLKWMLASNSVVIMPNPTVESWLMEGLLNPYVHYIPIKDDFSDLDVILEWCKNNDRKCREISQNANKWIQQFMDNEQELKLHNRITEWYKKNVVLK